MKESPQQRYERWWLGKYIKANGVKEFKLVIEIELIGPPSFTYGSIVLTFDDDTTSNVVSQGYRPNKNDVEVLQTALHDRQ